MRNLLILSMILAVMSCENSHDELTERDHTKSARIESDSLGILFPLGNEKFLIQPALIDSLKGKAILFQFITDKQFECPNNKLVKQSGFVGHNKLKIDLAENLILLKGCKGEVTPARDEMYFYFNEEGDYELAIQIGETNYIGNLKYGNGRYFISWPDNTPFRFTTKEV